MVNAFGCYQCVFMLLVNKLFTDNLTDFQGLSLVKPRSFGTIEIPSDFETFQADFIYSEICKIPPSGPPKCGPYTKVVFVCRFNSMESIHMGTCKMWSL